MYNDKYYLVSASVERVSFARFRETNRIMSNLWRMGAYAGANRHLPMSGIHVRLVRDVTNR